MAQPGDQMAAAAGRGCLKASDADREQVIDTIKGAFVQGRLTKDEFDTRIGQAFASRTYAELAAVTADIPAGLIGARPPRKPARARARVSLNKAVTGTACLILAIHAGMFAAILAGSGVAVLLVAVFTIIGATVAVGALIVAS